MDKTRMWLLERIRGYHRMLDECCTGANIHDIQNLRMTFRLWEEVLSRPDVTSQQVTKIEQLYPDVRDRARHHYHAWEATQRRKRVLDQVFDELHRMSPQEFQATLEEPGDDIGWLLYYGNHPDACRGCWFEPKRCCKACARHCTCRKERHGSQKDDTEGTA